MSVRLLVVSPHLDDAVLGCAEPLMRQPGGVVLTLFAGSPGAGAPLTDWDRACGFASADEAIRVRRDEDRHALQALGAEPRWLDFLDRQYAPSAGVADIAGAIARVLDELRPATLLLPLGLFHSDHLLAHRAAWQALQGRAGLEVAGYEDAIYRALPGLLQQRLAALGQAGTRATPAPPLPADAVRKRRALACYASQQRALGSRWSDALRPERRWVLEPGAAAP